MTLSLELMTDALPVGFAEGPRVIKVLNRSIQ